MKYCVSVLSGLVCHVKYYSSEKSDCDRVVKYFEFINNNEKYMRNKDIKQQMIMDLKEEIRMTQYI